jgi:hypothetical protein
VEGAREVHRQRAGPVRQAGLADVAGVPTDPGHVDHCHEPAQPLADRGEGGPCLHRVGDVGPNGDNAVPLTVRESGDRPAERRAVAIESGDNGPLGQAADCDGQADSGGGAGDEHRCAGEEASLGRAPVPGRPAARRLCAHRLTIPHRSLRRERQGPVSLAGTASALVSKA